MHLILTLLALLALSAIVFACAWLSSPNAKVHRYKLRRILREGVARLRIAFAAPPAIMGFWRTRSESVRIRFLNAKSGLRRFLYRIGTALRLAFAPPRQIAGVQFANIGDGAYDNGVRSYLPDATTSSRYLLYKKGTDTDHCAICGAGDDPLGPSDDQADFTTVPIAINLLGAVKGTVRIVTDGTINDGDYVKCGANGKGTQAATTNLSFGRAIIPTDASKADGDVITIIPMAPAKYVF